MIWETLQQKRWKNIIIKQQSVFIQHKKFTKHKYSSTDSLQWDTTVTIKRQFKAYIVTTIIIKHIKR